MSPTARDRPDLERAEVVDGLGDISDRRQDRTQVLAPCLGRELEGVPELTERPLEAVEVDDQLLRRGRFRGLVVGWPVLLQQRPEGGSSVGDGEELVDVELAAGRGELDQQLDVGC
jgi:hypothetical protein